MNLGKLILIGIPKTVTTATYPPTVDQSRSACHYPAEAALGGELAVPWIRNPL